MILDPSIKMAPEHRRILVRATNWLGDAVMSLPAFRALRDRYPHAHIAVLALPSILPLFAGEGLVDEAIPYDAVRGWKDLRSKWRLAALLRRRRFDAAILFQNAFEAAAVTALAGIPHRIGYARDGRSLLLTQAIAVPDPGAIPRHQRFYYLELLRRAGFLTELPPATSIRFRSASDSARAGHRRFSSMDWTDVTGVSPGAAYGTAKRWLPERFAEAAAALGQPVALFGSGSERALCDGIATDLAARGIPAHNFAGETSLREFIELTAACRVFLTNDSGGMHLASALGVPTVAIFGATDDDATGPTGEHSHVIRHSVECSPCLLRECPIDHRCMTAVQSTEVVQTALQSIR